VRPDGPAADVAQVITVELVALLVSLRERITALETRIDHALAAHPDAVVFTSLPRSGHVRAGTMLAEIGDAHGATSPTTPWPPQPASPRPPERRAARTTKSTPGCWDRTRLDGLDGARRAVRRPDRPLVGVEPHHWKSGGKVIGSVVGTPMCA